MIDVLKSVGFDYIFANPGSSFRSLHESAINYGGERYEAVDLAIAADAETTLPPLIEAVKLLINADRKTALESRGHKLAEAHDEALARVRDAAAYGWDVSPITTARLSAELWAVIKDEDWSLVSDVGFISSWPLKLWNFDKHYQYIGGAGGAGVGYGSPAAVGAALANRKYGRLTVSIQNDGDLMYAPGVLWTAAHHRIPLLSVMHNNRAYHQEVMHIQRMADRRNRGITRASIGTTLQDPPIDYAKVAQGMGLVCRGACHRSQRSWSRIAAGGGRSEARRARAGGRHDAASLRSLR